MKELLKYVTQILGSVMLSVVGGEDKAIKRLLVSALVALVGFICFKIFSIIYSDLYSKFSKTSLKKDANNGTQKNSYASKIYIIRLFQFLSFYIGEFFTGVIVFLVVGLVLLYI